MSQGRNTTPTDWQVTPTRKPRDSAGRRLKTFLYEGKDEDPTNQGERPISPANTPQRPTEPFIPQNITYPEENFRRQNESEDEDEEEDEENQEQANNGRLFDDEEYRDITGDTTKEDPLEEEEDPEIDRWQQALKKIAKEWVQIEEAIRVAKAKQANAASKANAEKKKALQEKLIQERKQTAYLLAKLDAIRNGGAPHQDPPSDPSSSDNNEEDDESKGWRTRKPKKSTHLPPPIIYHQPNIRFPEPPKFTGVGKQPVEKWLGQMDLYFEASGIRVKWTLYAAMLLQDNAATW